MGKPDNNLPNMEYTLLLIKPDGLNQTVTVGRAGQTKEEISFSDYVKERVISAGLEIIAEKEQVWDVDTLKRHYEEHKLMPFYHELLEAFGNKPIKVYILKGEQAIKKTMELAGPTNPDKAKTESPDTIRGVYALQCPATLTNNGVHRADSPESFMREALLYFPHLEELLEKK